MTSGLPSMPYKEVRAVIDQILQLDTARVPIELCFDLVGRLMVGLPYGAGPIHATPVYRARRLETIGDAPAWTDLWYPPEASKVPLGRLNQEGQPMFYGSEYASTAALEATWPAGGLAYVLECSWRATPTMAMLLRKPLPQGATENWRLVGIDYEKNVKAVHDFIYDQMTTDVPTGVEHLYKITNAIGDRFLSARQFDGLVYPSIARRQGTANVAMRPDRADALLRPMRIHTVHVEANGRQSPVNNLSAPIIVSDLPWDSSRAWSLAAATAVPSTP